MKGYIRDKQIEYVLFHLNLIFDLNHEIRKRILFISNKDQQIPERSIIFYLSDKEITTKFKTIGNIPVLFPLSHLDSFWRIQNNNLIFSDDIIKSAFYLLSGYQEYISSERDILGRYSAKSSIQFKTGTIDKPVVNYYFEAIKNGIREFSALNGIEFAEKKAFKHFGFILTHDVDRIKLYSLNYILFKIKEIAGLKKSETARSILIRQLWRGLRTIFSKKLQDPAWNFEYLRKIEKQYKISSTFFFLDDETRHIDADYSFSEERVRSLMKQLFHEGCEIGIHGNHNSATSERSLQQAMEKLGKVFPHPVKGIRQHRLRYEIPLTTAIHERQGFNYDSTLGYYDFEGFRNSFCLPFRLYDFKHDRTSEVWEIPLNVMDCTLLDYRGLSFDESIERVKALVAEVSKFSGVFILLWHNSYFDEVRFPGVHNFYERLLGMIMNEKPESMTGNHVIERIKKHIHN